MKASRLVCWTLSLMLGCSSVANADLLSLYTFDNTTNNAVGGVAGGTLVGNATYATSAAVGDASLTLDGSGDYVNCTTSGVPAGNQEKSGSIVFWLNTSTKACCAIMGAANAGSTNAFQVQLNANAAGATVEDSMRMYVRADDSSGFWATTSYNFNDGNWHQVVLNWNAVAGTDSLTSYVDGVLNTNPVTKSTSISTTDTFASWENPAWIGALGRATPSYFFNGLLDDVGVWNSELTATEARALYNMAHDSQLNYNAADVATLFGVFAAGAGATSNTSDGNTWSYVTGLDGEAGTVLNHNTLILDGSGNGVTCVPEPSAMTILASSIVGLLAYAWRKRR